MKRSSLSQLIVAALLGSSLQASEIRYRIVDFGEWSQAHGINAKGEVALTVTRPPTASHAFIYSNGKLKDLGTLGGSISWARGINDAGEVIGISCTAGESQKGSRLNDVFLYSNGEMRNLAAMVPIPASGLLALDVADINSRGQIVGWQIRSRGGPEELFCYENGQMTLLGGLVEKNFGQVKRINDSGEVVGFAKSSSGRPHGFLYSRGRMIDLGTFGGLESQANDINSAGDVVGWAQTKDGSAHAFFYSRGAMRDLGVPDGCLGSMAVGINSSGEIVGMAARKGSDALDAFRYSGNRWIDLKTCVDPGPTGLESLWDARRINDSGAIIGQTFENGFHAYLLVPLIHEKGM